MEKSKLSSGKRWTEEEIGIVVSNWDTSQSVIKNSERLASLLPDRNLEAIIREMYDFSKRGILKLK